MFKVILILNFIELIEECGLSGNLRRIGVLEIDGRKKETRFIIHVSDSKAYSGDIRESEEIKPEWFNINEIPFDFWFPHILQGNYYFKEYFLYQGKGNIIKKRIETFDRLDEV